MEKIKSSADFSVIDVHVDDAFFMETNYIMDAIAQSDEGVVGKMLIFR